MTDAKISACSTRSLKKLVLALKTSDWIKC